jgi:AraC-like DNA-binding protein
MKNNTLIPVYDLAACIPGTNFIMKKTEGTAVPSYLSVPHRHKDYKISFLEEGEVTHCTDFEKYVIKAPALILLAPDQVHQRMGDSYNRMVHISFTRDLLVTETQGLVACWEYMFGQVVIPVLNEDYRRELTTYMDLMYQEFTSNRAAKDLILKNLLNVFITCAARMVPCKAKENAHVAEMDMSQNKIVRQFKMLTDQHFLETTRVAMYADMLYVSPGHLNDLIKTMTGKTAKQVIDEKRVMEAKRLLFWGELSVKEIAHRLNFEDDGYFNRFFKKHTGQTPALFQRNTAKSTISPLIR